MPKHLITLIVLMILALPAWTQEEESPGETADATESGAETVESEESGEDEVDDADLDVQTYEEDDDDFVPTEEIPADEPIPFPSNI
jgi:hypothetical protein